MLTDGQISQIFILQPSHLLVLAEIDREREALRSRHAEARGRGQPPREGVDNISQRTVQTIPLVGDAASL